VEKGADGTSTVLGGRADEEAAPAVVSHSVQNGCPNKVEEAVAPITVSPMPRQQGSDNVEEVADPAAVSPVAQNCGLPQREEDKMDSLTAVLLASRSSAFPHAQTQSGPEMARQDGDGGENGVARLLGDAGELSSDGQERNRVVPTVAVLRSCSSVSMQNGDKGMACWWPRRRDVVAAAMWGRRLLLMGIPSQKWETKQVAVS
jgi:euchromatic histone-lysine N-methyltransferase